MRRFSVLLCTLVLVGAAFPAGQAMAEDAAPSCQSALTAPALPILADLFLATGKMAINSTCSANCFGEGTASCSGTTCSAVDRNCSIGQQGYAVCDGIYHYCDPCPPTCSAYGSCPGPDVHCTGTTTCSAANQNCSIGQQGYAECDGIIYACIKLCP